MTDQTDTQDQTIPTFALDPLRAAEVKRALAEGKPGALADFAAAARTIASCGAARADLDRLVALAASAGTGRGGDLRAALDWAHSLSAPKPQQVKRHHLPDLDVADVFADCPAARDRVLEVSVVAGAVPDVAAVNVLGFVSCALAARVVGLMRNRNGTPWRVWPHLYLAPEFPSGMGKTLTRDLVDVTCSLEWSRVAAERVQPLASVDAADREALTKQRRKLVGSGDQRPDEVNAEIARIDQRLLSAPLSVPDGPLLGSITPAQFVRVAQRSGFASLLPDEGKAALEAFLAGREGREQIDPLLCAFSAQSYANDTIAGETRGDRARFRVLHAAAVLPLQPGVLSPQGDDDARLLSRLESRGLLARLLVCRPRALTAEELRALREGPQPSGSATAWRDLLLAVATEPIGDHPYAPTEPATVPYSDEAVEALLAYQAECREAVAPGGSRHDRPGAAFYARLGDHAVRLALVLAVLREGRATPTTVTLADAQRAIRACANYFAPHGLAVSDRAIRDEVEDDSDRVLREVQIKGEITVRELRRKLGRGWGPRPGGKRSRVEDAIASLEDDGRVSVLAAKRGSRIVRLVE